VTIVLTEHLHSSFELNESQVSVLFPLKTATYEPVVHGKNSKSSETTRRRGQQKSWHSTTHVAQQQAPRCQLAHGAATCTSQTAWIHNQNSTTLQGKYFKYYSFLSKGEKQYPLMSNCVSNQ